MKSSDDDVPVGRFFLTLSIACIILLVLAGCASVKEKTLICIGLCAQSEVETTPTAKGKNHD